jgi:hypothetical protein
MTRPTVPGRTDELRAGTIAAASAECGLQAFGRHLTAADQAVLRQALYDLCYTAICAYVTIPAPPPADRDWFRNN